MKNLGESKKSLGTTIRRNKKEQIMNSSEEAYIDKMLVRFNFQNMHPQSTPIATMQVTNRNRKMRGECEHASDLNESCVQIIIIVPYR